MASSNAESPGSFAAKKITFEPIPEGYRVKDGDKMLAVVTTKQHLSDSNHGTFQASAEDVKNIRASAVVWSPMDRDSWSIHFTSPTMSVEEIFAITDSFPACA